MVLEKAAEFFKKQVVTAKVYPKIEVSFYEYSTPPEVRDALVRQWEALRPTLDSVMVKKAEWSDYGEERFERLVVELDGVPMQLTGPRVPNPNYKAPERVAPPPASVQADNMLSSMIAQPNNYGYYGGYPYGQGFLWAMQNASPSVKAAFLGMVKGACGETVMDKREIVSETTKEVLNILAITGQKPQQ